MAAETERANTRRIVIVGGGASGVLLAVHLLRDPSPDLRITLIEKRDRVGPGLAFGTSNADHLLNVRAANMSAFADEPGHFWNWVVASGQATNCAADPFCFVQRRVYGRYLADLVAPHLSEATRPARLDVVHGEAQSIADVRSGVAVSLTDGSTRIGHAVVLATGHDGTDAAARPGSVSAWAPSTQSVDRDATVLILGTGLTMVDQVLSLIGAGHRGPIVALSRRGLLPRVHRPVEPLLLDAADVPLGTELAHIWRWFRRLVRWHEARGGDWRSVVDGLRPFVQDIWQNMPRDAKRRFLVHARAWWDVHRHRMAPEVDSRIRAAIASGQLRILAGKLLGTMPVERGVRAQILRRGETAAETIDVGRIIECTGIVTDPRSSANRVVRSLFAAGLARVDPFGIGLDVTPECALIDANGRASQRIFALGPLTRATFWEIIAVPDIRLQCAALARSLTRPDFPARASAPNSAPTAGRRR